MIAYRSYTKVLNSGEEWNCTKSAQIVACRVAAVGVVALNSSVRWMKNTSLNQSVREGGFCDFHNLGIIILVAISRNESKVRRIAVSDRGMMKRRRGPGSLEIFIPVILYIMLITLIQKGCKMGQPHQICDIVPSAPPYLQHRCEVFGYIECRREGTLYHQERILKFSS